MKKMTRKQMAEKLARHIVFHELKNKSLKTEKHVQQWVRTYLYGCGVIEPLAWWELAEEYEKKFGYKPIR